MSRDDDGSPLLLVRLPLIVVELPCPTFLRTGQLCARCLARAEHERRQLN